nr:immunoglobulin heavy chain junction region [Mus musculus]
CARWTFYYYGSSAYW